MGDKNPWKNNAPSPDVARMELMTKFGLSDIQTQAILDMRLARLQGLEREKIENEFEELMKQITYFNEILSDIKMLMNIVKEEIDKLVSALIKALQMLS